jgi:hypothetical protein
MKITKYISFLIYIIAFPSCLFSQPQQPYNAVIVGDTTIFGGVRSEFPSGCDDYSISPPGFSHNPQNDFSVVPDSYYDKTFAYFLFTPKKVGKQIDTGIVSFTWNGKCPAPITFLDTVILIGDAISDSVSLVKLNRAESSYASANYRYIWKSDSNNYVLQQGPPWPPIEIINNVEDSTIFEFTFHIDSASHVRAWIVAGKDSSQFPYVLNCPPKVRRVQTSLYFYSDSKGFYKDTSFPAELKVVIKNSTKNDTLILGSRLYFNAVPLQSVIVQKPLDFSIFPNPAQNEILVKNPASSSIEIFDLLGRAVVSQTIHDGTDQIEVDISNLREGCYWVRSGAAVQKLLISR